MSKRAKKVKPTPEMPKYDVSVNLRSRPDQDWIQSDEITRYVAPMLIKMVEETCPADTDDPRDYTWKEWLVRWSETPDAVVQIRECLRNTDPYNKARAFNESMAKSLHTLAGRHPEELEEILMENLYARLVHHIKG